MSARPLAAWLRLPTYVCDTCRNNFRDSRGALAATSRSFSNASASKHDVSPRHISFQKPYSLTAAVSNRSKILQLTSGARSFASGSPATPHIGSGVVHLRHRHLILLSGADAAKFLQGLITNNVDPNRSSPFYAGFLDARGRVLWDVFIWVWPKLIRDMGHWACYIEVDESEVEALKKHLKRHKLRSEVQIEAVEGNKVWAVWGNDKDVTVTNIESAMRDPRAPQDCLFRFLSTTNCETIAADGSEPEDISQYHLVRYTYGIPEGPLEIPRDTALPMECNFDLYSGIDFKKGCYVGQELTIRTKHIGVVRKRVLPVQLQGSRIPDLLPLSGADIKQLDECGNIKKGRAAGKYITGLGNTGIAMCRLEMMTSMKIGAEGGTWEPSIEFGIETGNGVIKVQPVVQDWFVERERAIWNKNGTKI